jgi:hypothetical protein
MGDTTKTRSNPVSKRGSSIAGSSVDIRSLLTRSEINTRLSTEPNPVASASEAKSWLEAKGWILAGEDYTKPKLADILFTVALTSKLAPEASSAIKAVALLIEDLAEEDFSASLSDKIVTKITESIDVLRTEIDNAKEFLDATTQKQASITVDAQKAAEKNIELTNKLTEVSGKVSALDANPRRLASSVWPSLTRNVTAGNGPPPAFDPSLPPSHTKLQQRILLETQQALVEFDGPHDVDGGSLPFDHDRSAEAQKSLRDKLNGWLITGEEDRSKRFIRNVKIFERAAFLVEFDSPSTKDRFVKMCEEDVTKLKGLYPGARIKPRTYTVIFRFVPCTGDFDPYTPEHLRDLEKDNGLEPNSIVTASWCKRPENRAPNQSSANLKVVCANPETGNLLLSQRIRVEEHLVTVHKDLKQPVRCLRCQEYGHIRDSCTSIDRCAICTSEFHAATDCINKDRPKCVSCGDGSTHPSTSHTCPTYTRKLQELDARSPENAMPYFPTEESWTWVMNPPRQQPGASPPMQPQPRSRSPSPPPPPPQSTQRENWNSQRRDNGWPSLRRQSSIRNWVSQPAGPSNAQSTATRRVRFADE